MNDPARRAAIYARVSTEKQSQLSTADQVRKCREYATAHGIVARDDHVYVDEAVSGVGIDRASLSRMVGAAVSTARQFDTILIDDTSRLTRSTKDALDIFERMKFAGVQLVAVSQGIDSKDD